MSTSLDGNVAIVTGSGSGIGRDVASELDDHCVTVRLWRLVGRFRDGEVRWPPLALQKLDRPSAT
jgi:NAD(P)-dependent dehydrogenase (short-subunit alcohol dehydrogenase family)